MWLVHVFSDFLLVAVFSADGLVRQVGLAKRLLDYRQVAYSGLYNIGLIDFNTYRSLCELVLPSFRYPRAIADPAFQPFNLLDGFVPRGLWLPKAPGTANRVGMVLAGWPRCAQRQSSPARNERRRRRLRRKSRARPLSLFEEQFVRRAHAAQMRPVLSEDRALVADRFDTVLGRRAL